MVLRLAIEKNYWEGKTSQEARDYCVNEVNWHLTDTVSGILKTGDEKLIEETRFNLDLMRAFLDKKMMIGGVI